MAPTRVGADSANNCGKLNVLTIVNSLNLSLNYSHGAI